MNTFEVDIRLSFEYELESIRKLLEVNNLPVSDLSTNQIIFFVGTVEGKLVSCIGLEKYGATGLLRSLAVSNELKNRKIGRNMVNYLINFCSNSEIRSLYLLTTTASNFFLQIGFETIPRELLPDVIKNTSEFKDICPVSAISMFKQF